METLKIISGARKLELLTAALALAGVLIPHVAAAQQLPTAAPLLGAIAGTVTSKDGGQAIAGATVTLTGTSGSAITNDGGRFRIESLRPGSIGLTVKAPGYLEMQVTDISIQARETTVVGVELVPTPQFLDRVQVSATKTPLSIGDIAAQASVVDRGIIDARGDQTLTQSVANTTGALVTTNLGIFESVSLRGLPRGDPEFTSTLLLIDGVPQTLSNNGARVLGLTTNDASSIEIVRGPNSALYGRTAIGGSINMRTADPSANHSILVDFTGGEQGAAKGIVRFSGPLLDWGGYYVSLGKEREGGYFENKTTDDFVIGNRNLFTKITFNLGQQWYGSVSVNRVVSDNSTPTNEPIIDGQLLHNLEPGFDRFTNFNIPGRNYQQSEGRFTTNLTFQAKRDLKFVGVIGYRAVEHMFVEDGDFLGSPFDLDANTVTMYPFTQTTNEDVFYTELRAEYDPHFWKYKDSLILGASRDGNKGSLSSDFIFTDPDTGGWPMDYLNPVIPDRDLWQHDKSSRTYHLGTGALFAQYIVDPSPRTSIVAAGRWDHLSLENTRSSVSTKDSFSAFSPKVSAIYKLLAPTAPERPSFSVYGAYSHAFLPPRRPSSLVPDDVDLNLQPENINNYEGGVKGTVLNGKVSFDGSYFFMTENGVVLETRQGPFFLPTNSGEQRYKGFEGAAQFTVNPKLTVFGNAGIYHNRYGDFVIEDEEDPALDEDITGNRLPIAPDFIYNLGARVFPTPATEATFEVKRVGDVVTDRANTFTLDPYTLVDAAFSYNYKMLRFTLSGHNLFNTEYYSNGSDETADPGRPRQILFTTSVRVK